MNRVIPGPGYFPDPTIGRPVANGYIYVGIVDLDPTIVGNQKQISVLQEDTTTVQVAQPMRTSAGGVPVYNNSEVTILVDGNYSLTVHNSSQAQVDYIPSRSDLEGQTQNVDDMLGLIGVSGQSDGDTADTLGFFASFPQSEFFGGGHFVWQKDVDKALADGGTIVDPANIGGFDGTTSTLSAFLTAQGGGVGLGCWVKLDTTKPNITDFGAIPDGTTDNNAPITKALASSLSVDFPPGVINHSGYMELRNGHVLTSFGQHTNSDTTDAFGNTKLVFTGTSTSCIRNATPAASLLHVNLAGFSILASGTYDWIFDLNGPIGLGISDVRAETENLTGGGFRSVEVDSVTPTWTPSFKNFQIRVDDTSTGHVLDTDMGDGDIVGCSFIGGIGTILRGTGGIKLSASRMDRSNAVGLTISNETESGSQHIITGCQLELNATYGILVDGDADDSLVSVYCQPSITSCTFRNPGATDIKFLNATGNVLNGGVVDNNVHTSPTAVPLDFDRGRWKNIYVGKASTDNSSHTPVIYEYGPVGQATLTLDKSGVAVSHTGDTVETTLATITVPGKTLGLNGKLRITTLWSHTNSGNNKTLRTRYNSLAFSAPVVTATASSRILTEIMNRGAVNSQVGGPLAFDGIGSVTGAVVTAASNTANDLDITITAQLAIAGETITLESYSVEIMP